MTQPENFTAAQASDPATPGQVLADIAALRPDLRAAVASNPSAYPGLIDWLKSLGEPAVDAAIAARDAGPATQQMPVMPPTAPGGAQVPPAPQWAQQPQPQQPTYGAPPMGMPPGGMPPQGLPPQGMAPQGMAPQGGLQYGAPPAKSSNKALWIVLIILGVLVLLGVGAFLVVKALADKAVDTIDDIDITDILPTTTPGVDAGSYGDDPALDALWDACENEDWQACDDLYDQSPIGSEYEAFGDTCGNRQEAGTTTYCTEAFGGGTTTDGTSYGDDPALDALWDSCEGGDYQACDDLFTQSPADSEYEAFGDTCGNRQDPHTGVLCTEALGGGTTTTGEPFTFGDDATLDALWTACEGGDMQSCDDLYMQSPFGSDYEAFGDTCGNRATGGDYCVATQP